MMKKLLTIIMSWLTLPIFAGITPSSLTFDSPATGSQTFNLSINANATWVASAPDWINIDDGNNGPGLYTIFGTGSKTIAVSVVADNPSNTDPRSEDITIITTLGSSTQNFYITITQNPHIAPLLSLSSYSLNVISNYDEKTNSDITINSNYAWTATMDSWLELYVNNSQVSSGSSGEYSIQVKVFPNPSPNQRTGTITLSTGNATKVLTVTQVGSIPYIKFYNWNGDDFIPFTSDTLRFAWDDTVQTANPTGFSRLYVTNNVNWNYSFSDISWLTDLKSSMAGAVVNYWDLNSRLDSDLRITVSANNSGLKRTSILTLSANNGSISKQIVIAQFPKNIVSGIHDFLPENGITIYPNPSTGVINVKALECKTINIYNNLGIIQTIQDVQENQVFELPKGLYFVEVLKNNDQRVMKKIIIE